jgi:hypothetical protein
MVHSSFVTSSLAGDHTCRYCPGITKDRKAKILQAISESYSVPQSNLEKEAKRKRLEVFVQETRASSGNSSEDDSQEHQRQKEEELETAFFEGRAPNLSKKSKPLRLQLTETFEPTPEPMWEEIDMLEGDSGVWPCATPDSRPFGSRQKPFGSRQKTF